MPVKLQFLNDLISFQCLNKSLYIFCFFSCVCLSGPHLRVTTVVSACTEGMAQLLFWQLLNQHKLQLAALKYVEIGVYLSTWDCNHSGAAAASQTAEPTLQQGGKMKETARMTSAALGWSTLDFRLNFGELHISGFHFSDVTWVVSLPHTSQEWC